MRRLITALLCSGLMASALPALADDAVQECLSKVGGPGFVQEVSMVAGAVTMQIGRACTTDPQVAANYALRQVDYFETNERLKPAMACREALRADPRFAFLDAKKDGGKSICAASSSKGAN